MESHGRGKSYLFQKSSGREGLGFEGLDENNVVTEEENCHNIAQKLEKIKDIPAENLIELFKNPDESTIVHEFTHWWLDKPNKYSKNNEELALDMEAVRKFIKNDCEEFTREQHEKFARVFEAYIRSSYAKNNRLKKIFEDFINALLSIYDSLKQIMYPEN